MHHLQRHILSMLLHSELQRYADLKPDQIEGNLFMYHLRRVIKAGWVEKTSDGLYRLTSEGMRYVDGLSLATLSPRSQARLVTLLVIQNEIGEYLLYRRKRQPLLAMIGFPYGKIHLGESVTEAAVRELMEKTGLEAHLSHRGDGYITIYQGDEPVSQIFAHIFYGSQPTGTLLTETNDGVASWGRPTGDEIMPSVPDIISAISQNPNHHFFVEHTYR
jgi:ADP-ribose pyrophosphatase YjhB (NUDIX family)